MRGGTLAWRVRSLTGVTSRRRDLVGVRSRARSVVDEMEAFLEVERDLVTGLVVLILPTVKRMPLVGERELDLEVSRGLVVTSSGDFS